MENKDFNDFKEYKELHEQFQDVCSDLMSGKISREDYKKWVADRENVYQIGPGGKNELSWLNWKVENTKMSHAEKQLHEQRIKKLGEAGLGTEVTTRE